MNTNAERKQWSEKPGHYLRRNARVLSKAWTASRTLTSQWLSDQIFEITMNAVLWFTWKMKEENECIGRVRQGSIENRTEAAKPRKKRGNKRGRKQD